jgi:hypothetical protein
VTSREDKFRKKRYLALDERCKKHDFIANYAERTKNKERPERLRKQRKIKTKYYSNVRSFFLKLLTTERENNFVNAPEALPQTDIF